MLRGEDQRNGQAFSATGVDAWVSCHTQGVSSTGNYIGGQVLYEASMHGRIIIDGRNPIEGNP
jgi:hypothetical protein